MKLSLAVTGLTVLLVSATCQAITLKLDPQHQFLFRVEQLRDARKDASLRYQSAPMIVTFNAQVKTITIRLPALENRRERHHFDRTLNFQLVDEHGKEIDIRRDRLPLSAESDMEKAMILYNRNGQVASVPHFAAVRDGAANLPPVEAEFVWIDEAQSPAIKRWFHRFDQATRQQFMSLVKLLRTS